MGNPNTVTNSFYDKDVTSQNDSGLGTGKTTVEMKNPFTFIDAPASWDFATVWGKSVAGENNGYMMLRSLSIGLYDDYVRVGDASRTYGDANSTITGAVLSGVGTGNVTVGWGSAITAATNAGDYAYSQPNVITLTDKNGGHRLFRSLDQQTHDQQGGPHRRCDGYAGLRLGDALVRLLGHGLEERPI